ncbi:hypothetical protein [Eggerthella sinensis]|uniref:hypothetical protein n=1 Tax=Eggerthella sinensis TaxID=242230 RepID=UPI0022E60471|nr:hypothetical protein [Eggerthella sinensis]
MQEKEIGETTSFEKTVYGALLRNKRIKAGYRKADDFIKDLHLAGCKVSKAALYRIERGEQEPPVDFLLAANLILFGDLYSQEILSACIPDAWNDPLNSDDVLRILKKNSLLGNLLSKPENSVSRAALYDEIMSGLNSFDFEVFTNAHCDENHLYMTVATGYNSDMEEYEELESFEIRYPEEIERAIISFLKRHDYRLEGSEVEKLVKYGERKILPALADYTKEWNAK